LRKISKRRNDERKRLLYISPAFLNLPEERIIFKTHPHWLFIVVPEVTLAIFGILVINYLPFFLIDQIILLQGVLALFGAAWSFVMIVIFLDWICTNYYLTNLRLIEERGIIGKRIMSIGLGKVQDVTCKFGILGRIFGFGDIEIQSAGTYGKIVFGFLPSPRKLQEKIEEAILSFH
jgi:uncharacterized membrane protein YdbT with pleckstrin-like domain